MENPGMAPPPPENTPPPNEWGQPPKTEWESQLISPPERRFRSSPVDLLPKLSLFGSTGGKDWRLLHRLKIKVLLNKAGITNVEETVYDPTIRDREWTPADAEEESKMLYESAGVVHGLRSDVASVGGMVETGYLALASFIQGRKMNAFIDPTSTHGADVERARDLSVVDARHIQRQIPNIFRIHPDTSTAITASISDFSAYMQDQKSGIPAYHETVLLKPEGIENRVSLSGSSKDPLSEERQKTIAFLKQNGIDLQDAVRDDWSIEKYRDEELPEKDKSLVNFLLITDTTSLGAVKDVGLAIFRAVTRGTYAVINFPPDADDPRSDYSRGRSLAMSHYKLLIQDNPWISHYVRFVDGVDEGIQTIDSIAKAQPSKDSENPSQDVPAVVGSS